MNTVPDLTNWNYIYKHYGVNGGHGEGEPVKSLQDDLARLIE